MKSLTGAAGGDDRLVPTGVAPLDRLLGGGFVHGWLAAIVGSEYVDVVDVVQRMLATTHRHGGEPFAIVRNADLSNPYCAASEVGAPWVTDLTYAARLVLPVAIALASAGAHRLVILDLGAGQDKYDHTIAALLDELRCASRQTGTLCVAVGEHPIRGGNELLERLCFEADQLVALERDADGLIARYSKSAEEPLPVVCEVALADAGIRISPDLALIDCAIDLGVLTASDDAISISIPASHLEIPLGSTRFFALATLLESASLYSLVERAVYQKIILSASGREVQ